jgi:hypothetical protein
VTTFDRYRKAAADLDAHGIVTVISHGRAHDELTADDAWCKYAHLHGGRAAVAFAEDTTWFGGELRHMGDCDSSPVRSLFFSHPHGDLTVAEAVVAAFTAEGFNVRWDSNPHNCVVVHLNDIA